MNNVKVNQQFNMLDYSMMNNEKNKLNIDYFLFFKFNRIDQKRIDQKIFQLISFL
jgi:hypothetical protein